MRMHTARRVIVMTAIVLFATIGAAYAETSATNSTLVTANVPGSIEVSVPTTFGIDAICGILVEKDLSIEIHSNTTWSLTVVKNHDLMAGTMTIPSSRFTYAVTDGRAIEFPSAPRAVASGLQTGIAGRIVAVTYRLMTTDDDAAGTYSATHTYVATTP